MQASLCSQVEDVLVGFRVKSLCQPRELDERSLLFSPTQCCCPKICACYQREPAASLALLFCGSTCPARLTAISLNRLLSQPTTSN